MDNISEECLNQPYGLIPNDHDDDSNDEFQDAQSEPEGQPGEEAVEVYWNLEYTFPNLDDCMYAINEDECWTKQKVLYTTNGTKTGYRCKHVKRRGKQCSAGIYTIHDFEPNNTAVRLYRKNLSHDHGTNANQVTALSDVIKQQIIQLYDTGLKPKGILYRLQQDPENVVPSIDRIRNVIEMHKLKKYGKSNMTMNELQTFCNAHSAIPDDDDTAFVAAFERSRIEDDEKWFRLFITTKRLLINSIKAACIHADGTYKMNIQNFPVLTIGTTDKDQTFHLLGLGISTHERAEDYGFLFDTVQRTIQRITNSAISSRVLMADGAAAIHNGFQESFAHLENLRIMMCWYHVLYNVNKQKFRSPENKELIKKDLTNIHYLCSEELFDQAFELFVKKWLEKEPDFCQYFDTYYMKRNKNWFHIEDRIPTTNNAIESFHSSLKTHQTYWQKKGISEFKNRALEIVEERSREYNPAINEKPKNPFAEEATISGKLKSKGFELAKSPLQFVSVNDGNSQVIYCRSKYDTIGQQNVDAFLNIEWDKFEEFDKFIEAANSMRVITFPGGVVDWKNAKCTCSEYIKEFMCKHIIAVAVRVKVLKPDTDPDDEPLKPNRKKGRPKKFTKGLSTN